MSSIKTTTSAFATAPEKTQTNPKLTKSPHPSPESPSSRLTPPPSQSPINVDVVELHEDQSRSQSQSKSQSQSQKQNENKKQKQKQVQQPQMQHQNPNKRSNQNLMSLQQQQQQQLPPSHSQHTALSSSKPHRHVVGRFGSRNLSGKNLNKMGKVAKELGEFGGGEIALEGKQQQQQQQQRHHRRSASGTLMTARAAPSSSSTSPRAGGVRRNLSTLSILKHNTSQTRLKKDHSSGQLVRAHGSARNVLRMTGKDGSTGAPKRRSLSGLGKPPAQRQEEKLSPSSLHAPHAVVRFDIGDDEVDENGEDVWTESSASQSPAVTRSNSRASPRRPDNDSRTDISVDDTATNASNATMDTLHTRVTQQPDSKNRYRLPPPGEEDDASAKQPLHRYSVGGDDDEQPRVSSISGTVVASGPSDFSRRAVLGTRASEGSTLVDHSGTDLVSRFIQDSGSAGTPQDAVYMRLAPEMRRRKEMSNGNAAAGNSEGSNGDENENENENENDHRNEYGLANGMSIDTRQDRRSRSIPNIRRGTSSAESDSESNKSDAVDASPKRRTDSAAEMKESSSQGKNIKSGTAIPSSSSTTTTASKSKTIDPLLLPSRTQRKLWLQRASSNMEPGSVMPVTLPRSTSILIGAGAHHSVAPMAVGGVSAGGDSNARIDPRLQRQFDQTEAEYRVVRRFRSPVAEAVARLQAGRHWSISTRTMTGSGVDLRSEKEPLMNDHSGLVLPRSASAGGIEGRNGSSSNRNGVKFNNTSQQSQRNQQPNGPQPEHNRNPNAGGESNRPMERRTRVSFEIAPSSLEKDGGQAERDKARRDKEERRSGSTAYGSRNGVGAVRNGTAVHDSNNDNHDGGNDDDDDDDDDDYVHGKDADADAEDVDALATFEREEIERENSGSGNSSRTFEAEDICRRLWDSVQILGED